MIKERYCSSEVSRLLREKGFDEACTHLYYNDDLEFVNDNAYGRVLRNSSIANKDFVTAPTHQMACDWLRKTYNIHIGVNPISGKGYNATIYDVADFDDYGIIGSTKSFFHVEEACEAALKYVLENLV